MEKPPQRGFEISLPMSFWGVISQDDKNEYLRLRQTFINEQKQTAKDRKIITFHRELTLAWNFIKRSDVNIEERSIITGICFAGKCLCINTRLLKCFLGRCKSSINGSLQQMGYIAIRTKTKARGCILALMPSLQNEPVILRQWSVRCPTIEANSCFAATFPYYRLPDITDEDFIDERRISKQEKVYMPPMYMHMQQQRQIEPEQPIQYDFKGDGMYHTQDFTSYTQEWDNISEAVDDDNGWDQPKSVPRSSSAFVPQQSWDFFDSF